MTSLHGQTGLGEPLRRQASQVGIGRADRWIALSDGASGLEDWPRQHRSSADVSKESACAGAQPAQTE